MKQEKLYQRKLFRLMCENPDLPVVPMVNGEITEDDSGWWMGRLADCIVDEFLFCEKHDSIVFKSDNNIFGTLEEYLTYEEFEKLPETESECKSYYDNLPWEKAIIVYIDTF